MADLSVTLSEIELKIRKLIALKNQLEEENSKLIQRNEDLEIEKIVYYGFMEIWE